MMRKYKNISIYFTCYKRSPTGITCFVRHFDCTQTSSIKHHIELALELVLTPSLYSRVWGDRSWIFTSHQCEYFLYIIRCWSSCIFSCINNHGKCLVILWKASGFKSTNR